MIKVFISYSHDSPEHADKVLGFAKKLRSEGIDAILDQYEESPAEGWPKWMDRQIEDSDFILLVCTERYYRKVMGTVDKGLGVKWESTLAYQDIYDAGAESKRFIPVLFKGGKKEYIPKPFAGATHYYVENKRGYENLYRRLTGQPETKKPKLGKLKPLGVREPKTNFFVDAGRDSSGGEGAGDKPPQEEAGAGAAMGVATGGKHPKVVHIEEIAETLKSKNRHNKPHICHQDEREDEENRRVCPVQKGTVALAKEVGNFDRDTNGRLAFSPVLHALETSACQAYEGVGMMRMASLEVAIQNLFGLFGINKVELDEMYRADDELPFLEEFKKKVLSALDGRIGENSSTDEVGYLIESLSSVLLGRNVAAWQGKEYDEAKNLAHIKTRLVMLTDKIFGTLKDDIESAYKDIDEAMGSFSDPPPEAEPPEKIGAGERIPQEPDGSTPIDVWDISNKKRQRPPKKKVVRKLERRRSEKPD